MVSSELLRRFPLFQDASELSLRQLGMAAEEVSYDVGDLMFQDDAPANVLFLLLEGDVDIQYLVESGEHVTVDILGAGDLVVWSALIPPYRCTAAGRARTPVKAIAVLADRLRDVLSADHELGWSVMLEVSRVLAERLQAARVQLIAGVEPVA